MDLELDAKRIDLLHEAVPELTRARLLTTGSRGSSNQRGAALARELQASAQTLGVALEIVQADAPDGTWLWPRLIGASRRAGGLGGLCL